MQKPKTDTPDPIALRTRRDYTITTKALKLRAEGLEKLAKKNEEEGYEREARTQSADAAAIKLFILPAFQEQAELPLVTEEDMRLRIGESIRDVVSGALVVRAPEEKQTDMLRSREDSLVESLSMRIEAFATEIAQEAYWAGHAARDNGPILIANRCLAALQGGRN